VIVGKHIKVIVLRKELVVVEKHVKVFKRIIEMLIYGIRLRKK
jgi:hypothetical protein